MLVVLYVASSQHTKPCRQVTLPSLRLLPRQASKPTTFKMRGYVSMVGDLFHVGHINLLRAVSDLGYDVMVGVHSDEGV